MRMFTLAHLSERHLAGPWLTADEDFGNCDSRSNSNVPTLCRQVWLHVATSIRVDLNTAIDLFCIQPVYSMAYDVKAAASPSA